MRINSFKKQALFPTFFPPDASAFTVLFDSGLIRSSYYIDFIAMGIFVKVKDIALIWDQNELPSPKGSWKREKNRYYLLRNII